VPQAEHTVLVPAPIAKVFSFLGDPRNDPLWRPGVREMSLASGRVGEAGATYRQRAAGPFGRPIAADIEVTAVEPERRIAFRAIAGPARPEGSYTLETVQGGTQVRFELHWSPEGLRRLMAPMVSRTMRAEVEHLDDLAAAIAQAQG
jgi:uncharacterized protein YndB with AHSA1/START domain